MGNGPSFSHIGTHGLYAKNNQGILKVISDEALIAKGLRTLASVSPFDRVEADTKKLGTKANVNFWCKKMKFANCPQKRVVLVVAPDGQARSRNKQFKPYENGTMWMEINENFIPKTHESTVEFYPRYHNVQQNF